MNKWMKIAIQEAYDGINSKEGGPFGAAVIKNNTLISSAHNQVLKTNDPSAHAEVQAIRSACSILNKPHLSDCILYTTCEPCPMCLGTIYWARIPIIYYGCSNQDAGRLGFIDENMHKIFNITNNSSHQLIQIEYDECIKVFEYWQKTPGQLY